jgi:hypothetical protein
MTIQPTKSLEHSLYAAAVFTGILLTFGGFRDTLVLVMLLVLVISESFRRWRGPQTAQEESLNATDFTALNISKK